MLASSRYMARLPRWPLALLQSEEPRARPVGAGDRPRDMAERGEALAIVEIAIALNFNADGILYYPNAPLLLQIRALPQNLVLEIRCELIVRHFVN